MNHHQCLVGAGRARAYVDHLKGFVGPGRHASADVLARLGGSNPRRSLGIDEGVFDVPPDFDEPLPD